MAKSPDDAEARQARMAHHVAVAELGQIYATLNLIRSSANELSNLVGQNMEQRDNDELDRISAIANSLVRRVMASSDKLAKGG